MFNGSIVALITPFTPSGETDYGALANLVRFHLDAGTDGLVIGGTTGESATLRPGELPALLDAVTGQVAGQVPVIAGTGTAATDRTVENTRMAAAQGVDAVLVVTPYYNRPTQHGLVEHYRAVADCSDKPVILYNVPSRTAVDMQPETVQMLAAHDRIVAVKEAVSSNQRVVTLRRLCGADFGILSGDDGSFLESMKTGAQGVISVAANVVPGPVRAICRAALKGDWAAAEAADSRLRRLYELLMIETNPIPVKWALHEMALCSPQLRLRLTPLSANHRETLRNCLDELGALNT